MENAGGGEGDIPGGKQFGLTADHGLRRALHDDVQLVLPFVRVGGVFLAGFEGIQAGEQEVALSQCAFGHAIGGEGGLGGGLSDEHSFHFRQS